VTLPDLPSSGPAAGDDIKAFYVNRLERLIRLRRDFEEHLNTLGVELLDRSIYSTFRDCVEHGAAKRAKALMDGWNGSTAYGHR
jgi:hypothetical protein